VDERHDTYRVYLAAPSNRGWRSRCRVCPRWSSEPDPDIEVARAAGRVHELYPAGLDWAAVEAWK